MLAAQLCRLRKHGRGSVVLLIGESLCGPFFPLPPADEVSSLKFTDAFAFGAPRVIGHYIGIWMISYGDRVIVAGMNTISCISSLLYASDLGRQTSVLYLHRDQKDGAITKARFTWEHSDKRPNTHTFPVACSECNHVRSWSRKRKNNGNAFNLRCEGKFSRDGVSVRCPGTYSIGPRPLTTPVDSPYIGRWLSYNEFPPLILEPVLPVDL